MSETLSAPPTKSHRIKQAVVHEAREYAIVVAYLALFFFAFSTYKMMLLHEFGTALETYSTAFVNAFIVGKVILIGRAVKLGHRFEHRSVLLAATLKAILFAILTALFRLVEELVRGLIAGKDLARMFQVVGESGARELAIFGVLCFCVFLPFFALMEIRRVMGQEQFYALFLRRA